MEIEGLDNTEYHHNYSHDEENLAFTTAFPSFSYIYANGGTLSFNAAGGMHARNTGGTVKNASESTAITADLNKFLQDEERETASAYLSMRPELQNKMYGRGSSALQGNGGVNSDGLGGSAPKAPLLCFTYKFPKISAMLQADHTVNFLVSGIEGSVPAAITKDGVTVAEIRERNNDCQTLRGVLQQLEEVVAGN